MLAVLMYHDVVPGGGKYANDPDLLRAHLEYVRANHPVVLPGEPLQPGKLNVCLTFDDAHVGFFHFAYPLLRELGLRAVVGVSTDVIREETTAPIHDRLRVSSQAGRNGNTACFCTWRELREMQDSGTALAACHSAGHQDLTGPGVDLDREIRSAGQIIADHLGRFPNTYVYPSGLVNRRIDRLTARHYPYRMRIGAALNHGWRNPGGGPLYRLQGDGLHDERGPLGALWKPRLRFYWNVLRGR
ncbi:Polysaccharide deacetylase [Desulfonatronum zhilinae]|nr:Polysaccharide deacetylase [Desulfonatronum zhilinae]